MKLLDIIDYLRHRHNVGQLFEKLNLSTKSEAILIYMKDSLDLNSELVFFEIEETQDDLIFKKDNVTYHQLFSVDHVVDILSSYFSDREKRLDNIGLAKRLLEYRINDA